MKSRDLAELLLLAALWGGSFLFMRIAVPSLGPIWLIALRVLIAGLGLVPLVIHRNLGNKLRQHWRSLLIVGGLNSALPFALFAFAALSLPAGFTSILNATVPLFGTVVAAVWLKERLTLTRIIGLILGFVGVSTLVGQPPLTVTPDFLGAVCAGLVASLLYALTAPYIKQTLAGVPSLVVATGSQLGAACLLLPALPFALPTQPPSVPVLIAVVALALFSTSLAYILYFRLLNNIGVTRTLTVTYLIPLFAMFWGALFLQEAITLTMVLGCGLILGGTAIINGVFTTKSSASGKGS